jgi:hypothetical protein
VQGSIRRTFETGSLTARNSVPDRPHGDDAGVIAVVKAEPLLDYARPAIQRGSSGNRAVYVALACGLTPAIFGTIVVLLWLLTRYGGIAALGVVNILFGLGCTVVGGIALLIHFWRALGSRRRPVRSWLVSGVVAGAVLLGNFPLCVLCIRLGDMNRLEVVNASGANVSSLS